MKSEKWICTYCDEPCILKIPNGSVAVPLMCPMSVDFHGKPNWNPFNDDGINKDNKKIVNITLKGVTKFSYDGHIDIEIPDDVVINFKNEK